MDDDRGDRLQRSTDGCKPITRRVALRAGATLLGALTASTYGHVPQSSLRVSSLRFGSLSWLLDTIRDQRIDAKLALDIDVVDVATNQAGPVALLAGDVDVIVSDWPWALRQRSEGRDFLFAPYSSALGALMVPAASPVRGLSDLAGRRLGVAGSPIDKSWLLLRAYSRHTIGQDIADVALPVFAAAPLLTEELRNGRIDAALNFWTFAARLQAGGFAKLLDMADVLNSLGIEPAPTLVGFVFSERSLMAKRAAFDAFFRAVAEGNTVLARSDAAWERLRPLVRPADDAELTAIRSFYRAGIPRPWSESETRSAQRMFDILAALGDRELVGPRTRFDPRLFHGAA
jgi:NitT/TauT family transport system substrate-binding protein